VVLSSWADLETRYLARDSGLTHGSTVQGSPAPGFSSAIAGFSLKHN